MGVSVICRGLLKRKLLILVVRPLNTTGWPSFAGLQHNLNSSRQRDFARDGAGQAPMGPYLLASICVE